MAVKNSTSVWVGLIAVLLVVLVIGTVFSAFVPLRMENFQEGLTPAERDRLFEKVKGDMLKATPEQRISMYNQMSTQPDFQAFTEIQKNELKMNAFPPVQAPPGATPEEQKKILNALKKGLLETINKQLRDQFVGVYTNGMLKSPDYNKLSAPQKNELKGMYESLLGRLTIPTQPAQ